MVLVAATLSATEVNEILHKLDRFEPLELLEAQLIPVGMRGRRCGVQR